MFKPVKAKNVNGYIEALEGERKSAIIFLHKFIQETVPEMESFFAYNMLGYGKFKYKNYKNDIIDWPVISLASQKNYISIYICSVVNGKYLAEVYKESLGKVSVGRSCIRFKKIEDVNLNTLKKVIKQAAENPGLGEKK